MTRSKYNAKRCEIDGEKFDSRLEARRFAQLQIMERAGRITKLARQVRFPLKAGLSVLGHYVADFVYLDLGGTEIVEDAKGVLTPLCRWKLKHMAAQGNPVTLWPPKKIKARKAITRKKDQA
jgi:hypothetical protein